MAEALMVTPGQVQGGLLCSAKLAGTASWYSWANITSIFQPSLYIPHGRGGLIVSGPVYPEGFRLLPGKDRRRVCGGLTGMSKVSRRLCIGAGACMRQRLDRRSTTASALRVTLPAVLLGAAALRALRVVRARAAQLPMHGHIWVQPAGCRLTAADRWRELSVDCCWTAVYHCW